MKSILLSLNLISCLIGFSQNKTNSANANPKQTFDIAKVGILNYFDKEEIPISVFDATDSLTAYLESNGIKKRVEVIKGDITFNKNGKTTVAKLTSKGKIKKEDLEIIKKLPVGTTIFIDKILLKYPDQSIKTSYDIKFKLSKWKVLTD